MNAPARESRLNRLHLSVTIVTSLLAAGLGIYGLVNKDQAQNLSVDVQVLNEDVASLESERDALAEQVDDLESQLGAPTVTAEEVSAAALALDDNVGLQNCSNTVNHGEWNAEPVRFSGDEHLHAFSCVPYISSSSIGGPLPIGYADFLVDGSAQRLVGLAGFDEQSADTGMTAEFTVQTVPESAEPLFTQSMSFGDVAEFDVDVSGQTRIRLQVHILDTALTDQVLENTASASWADVRFE